MNQKRYIEFKYMSEMMTLYFNAQNIYYRTEYFQFNIKNNTISDKRIFFYETLQELDNDVKIYYNNQKLKSKYYNFLPLIKDKLYDLIEKSIQSNRYILYDPVSQKYCFDGLMRKYFDILYAINMYKFDNPDYDFENISNDYSFENKLLSY